PMVSPDGRWVLALNGEIYNYAELAETLRAGGHWRFTSSSDTEVLLAAWATWGEAALDRLVGMFAFVVWDAQDRVLVAARDRFGVKPLYLHQPPVGGLVVASEIDALQAAGIGTAPDPAAWAPYLLDGRMEFTDRSFWSGVEPLPPGHLARWRQGDPPGSAVVIPWYDVAAAVDEAGWDERTDDEVLDHYEALVREAVGLRFRSDVPVGIAISGGLDSSTLLALVDALGPDEAGVHAFTFTTGNPAYDELPWVQELVAGTAHPLHACRIGSSEVPEMAEAMTRRSDGPFGGIPTLAYARLFEQARAHGVTVVLDGQGMDEQWAGYDYYRSIGSTDGPPPVIQGSTSSPLRPGCVSPELQSRNDRARGRPSAHVPGHFETGAAEGTVGGVSGDPLVAAQIRDLTVAKLPRALRFNDRASMASSCELREPFLDHRLVELALRQPRARKIDPTTGKVLLRRLAHERLGARDVATPKRPVQTPQREWLRGPLRGWVSDVVADGLAWQPDWLDATAVTQELDRFFAGEGDNAFYVWQWISLGLTARTKPNRR
ncbi:MAG TPA: asparagine synthase (glutamine-hydrolyzing), partial [Acidimicrobiales bacterium]